MESSNPQRPTDDPATGTEPDALRRLEERLSRASDAAERLIAEAARAAVRAGMEARAPGEAPPVAGRAGEASPGADELAGVAGETSRAGPNGPKPPPSGWQAPEPGDSAGAGRPVPDTELLAQILHSLRDLIPAELQKRLVEAVRELLLALRALLDWYIERLERRRAQPVEVQDIPIL